MAEQSLAKVVDFVALGALFGPGAPDPIWFILRLRLSIEDIAEDMDFVCFVTRVHKH